MRVNAEYQINIYRVLYANVFDARDIDLLDPGSESLVITLSEVEGRSGIADIYSLDVGLLAS